MTTLEMILVTIIAALGWITAFVFWWEWGKALTLVHAALDLCCLWDDDDDGPQFEDEPTPKPREYQPSRN